MGEGRVLTEAADGIGRIVLDNPKRLNAVSLSMWGAISQALTRFEEDPAIRCVIVTGAGDRNFCSGADVSEFGDGAGGVSEAMLEIERHARQTLAALHAFPRPVIARVRGYCIGAGLAIATACDLRIAETGASFGIPAAKLGAGYDAAGLARLAALVGPARAKMILFTARRHTAEDALRIGLVDEVTEPHALDRAVEDLAQVIAQGAPLTIAAAKAALTLPPDAAPADRQRVHDQTVACFRSADFAEGRRAFEEKRAPVFRGR